MIVTIVRAFGPPQAEALIEKVSAGALTVKDGVEQMFALIPSAKFEEMRQFAAQTARLRDGFPEFVRLCADNDWLLAVVSGGFDFFVDPLLAPFRQQVQVFCNRMDASGPFLKVIWGQHCDDLCEGGCGLCKPSVLRAFDGLVGTKVVIGDGVTDIRAALSADFVFARDRLLNECIRRDLPHQPFDTFRDIVRSLHHSGWGRS